MAETETRAAQTKQTINTKPIVLPNVSLLLDITCKPPFNIAFHDKVVKQWCEQVSE